VLGASALAPLAAQAASPGRVQIEVAVEDASSMAKAQEWQQLFSELGVSQLRIRTSTGADQVGIERSNSKRATTYRVTGKLTSRGSLELPGGRFSLADRAGLKRWIDELAEGGVEAVTQPRAQFGLLPTEAAQVERDFARPVTFSTRGISLGRLVEGAARQIKCTMNPDDVPARARELAIEDELVGLATGTALAFALDQAGLAMTPSPARGKSVSLEIGPRVPVRAAWPIGRAPTKPPADLFPELFEQINAEITDTSVADVLEAVGGRLKRPVLLDRRALRSRKVDITQVTASLPARRMSYSMVLSKVLRVARLSYEVRLDDAGQPFLWIKSTK